MAPLNRSTSAPHHGQLQIQHFTHHHPLHKLFIVSDFNCDGCNTAGFGVRFRCVACDFDLHEQCATAPHHISGHIHPHHQLALVNRAGKSHFCDVCKGFTNGLSYTCQPCGFDAHPICALITPANGVPTLTSSSSMPAGRVGFAGTHMPHPASFGGYHGVDYNNNNYNHCSNNNQPTMINHHYQQQQQQQQKQGKSNKYSNAGKIAASVLATSLTGIPFNFSSKK